jgi:hypothetical protein
MIEIRLARNLEEHIMAKTKTTNYDVSEHLRIPEETGILLCLLAGIMLPFLLLVPTVGAASPSGLPKSGRPATKKAYIVGFNVENEGKGSLRIVYNNGTEVEIPKERGRFNDGDGPLTQEAFSDIQLADDHQHIGWLADYMICAQSYPCSSELVIYGSGHKLNYVSPPYGVFWYWKFLEAGKRIAVQFGFPHGEQPDAFALYDTKTGRKLAEFFTREEDDGPNWVQQLRRSSSLRRS